MVLATYKANPTLTKKIADVVYQSPLQIAFCASSLKLKVKGVGSFNKFWASSDAVEESALKVGDSLFLSVVRGLKSDALKRYGSSHVGLFAGCTTVARWGLLFYPGWCSCGTKEFVKAAGQIAHPGKLTQRLSCRVGWCGKSLHLEFFPQILC